jgi:hypothetical protein
MGDSSAAVTKTTVTESFYQLAEITAMLFRALLAIGQVVIRGGLKKEHPADGFPT